LYKFFERVLGSVTVLHLVMRQTNRLYQTPNPNPSPIAC